MRDLIGKRPNQTPVGIGHSESEIDLTVLGAANACDNPSSGAESVFKGSDGYAAGLEEVDGIEDSGGKGLSSSDDEGFTEMLKGGVSETERTALPAQLRKRTAPQPNLSKPLVSRDRPLKKSKISEDFTSIAIADAQTMQKELDISKIKKTTKLERLRQQLELKKLREAREARKEAKEVRKLELRA